MKKSWNKIKSIASGLKGLTTIGIADVIGSAVSAIFWFYMATILGAEHYGGISYFLAIASIASTISLIGATSTITVYTAKDIKIQPPIYFISIIVGVVTSAVLYFIFHNMAVSVLTLGYVILVWPVRRFLAENYTLRIGSI